MTIEDHNDLPLTNFHQVLTEAKILSDKMTSRRSYRSFTDQEIDPSIIEHCLSIAGHAPSGANKQPWHFCVVKDKRIKQKIRQEAEKHEWNFYHGKTPQSWLNDLRPLKTNYQKPYLEDAPALIVIFAKSYEYTDGQKSKSYYVKESVGIATGMLIMSLHLLGLASLTHTPSPMNFLSKVLKRPANEKPYMILAIGYPDPNYTPPNISKKELSEIMTIY